MSLFVSDVCHLVAVVDDEPAVRKALERLLRSAGMEAQTFASGVEFLESLSRRRPACVVLDLHMPRMNGFDVQARLASEAGEKIAVVAITGHDAPAAQERALAGGAVAYLRKPVDARALLGAIRAVCDQKTP